jgi:deoxyribonuclease IV
MRKIGVHLSISGGLHLALEKAAALKLQAVQIFLKNSNRWVAKPYTDNEVEAFMNAWSAMPDFVVYAHSGYLINPAGTGEILEKSITALADELSRALKLKIPYLVLHPGSHGGRGLDAGIACAAESLSRALDTTSGTCILLETTAGQGSSIGHRFEHLRAIIDAVSQPERLGVCLDTCHVFAAGYDISDKKKYSSVMKEFDTVIGFTNLKLVHINDSKKECGSKVDRHEHIGKGAIGAAGFRLLLHDPKLKNIPLVLETPKFDDDEADMMNLKKLRALMK